jgi:hypothetical protein
LTTTPFPLKEYRLNEPRSRSVPLGIGAKNTKEEGRRKKIGNLNTGKG